MSKYTVAIINLLSSHNYKPLNGSEIRRALGIPKKQKTIFYKELKKLKKEGKIKKISHSRYVIKQKNKSDLSILQGTLIKRDGIFFLQRNNDEIRLPRLINISKAAEGDEVVVKIDKKNIGITSKILKVTKRRTKTIIGYLIKKPKGWIVVPIDRKIPFVVNVKEKKEKLKEGWLVLANITSSDKTIKGEIKKIYGNPLNEEIDEEVVIDKFNLPHEFSENIQKELDKIKQPTKNDIENRVDFRNLLTITIDGADAKDFDDAIDIEKKDDGSFKLYVHIADVSHYVTEETKLNQEALDRGFSVYFPGNVIPMLPFKLSNDICSLVPDKDRLTVSIIMEITKNGVIKKYSIVESVIRNKNRMTYDQVQNIIDNKEEIESNIKNYLKTMKELAKILRKRRFRKGSLDLDIPEPYFVVENGRITDIQERPYKFSHSIIEEFMLAANLCAADFLKKHYETYIRRIHEDPDPVKLANLLAFLRKMGIKFELPEEFTSKDLKRILKNIKDDKLKKIVSQLMLRSLKRAEYSTKNKGHFALHFDNYTHFTSPIRRYPDLIVHRMIKATLNKKKKYFEDLESEVKKIQERELVTENAMFYMNDIKAAQFMTEKIGETFKGIITTIVPSGFFVRLSEYFIEGFVPVSQLKDDYYQYIEHMYAMVGKRKRRIFKLGDEVKVMVIGVNKFAGEIDFTVV